MDVSIIIVNYCTSDLVIDCVNSIYDKTSTVSYEIIIVDNNSGDNSAEKLSREFGDKVILVKSDVNLGFGKANNLGAEYANGEYLFLLNPDTVLMNDAVGILHKFISNNQNAGIAGGNLYSPEGKPTPSFCMKFDDLRLEKKRAAWSSWLSGKFKSKLLHNSSDRIKEFNYSDYPQKVAYVFGADIMIKKSLFLEIGGFDPDFFMYAEEEEMSWRITEKGFSVYSVPQAKIIHLEGAATSKHDEFSERQVRMRLNGTMTYYYKRFGKAGVMKFYKYRSKRYKRLIRIAKALGKYTADYVPCIQLKLLDEEYNMLLTKAGTLWQK